MILIFVIIILVFLNYCKIYRDIPYAVLEIPKINLEKNIYPKDSKDNDLNKGLYLLKDSIYLEEENSKIFIASHSWTASISYFKNLDELKINDLIKIKRKNTEYYYRICDIYYEEKDGTVNIKDYDKNYLSLITCTKNNPSSQTVIIAVLFAKYEI